MGTVTKKSKPKEGDPGRGEAAKPPTHPQPRHFIRHYP